MIIDEGAPQMSFCPKTPKLGVSKLFEIEIPSTLEACNFLCKPLIEVMPKEKL
jgi:hypothetical protein